MPIAIKPLSKAEFEKKITGLDQKFAVGNGLHFHARGGSALWIFQYRDGASHRATSLGSYPDLSLNAARMAREARAVARRSNGGTAAAVAVAGARGPTVTAKRQRFAEVLEGYIAVNAPQWKPSNREKLTGRYQKLAAMLGKLWANEIETSHVETALKPMTLGQADKTRMRLKLVLDYAAAKGLRDKNIPNPAAKDILKHLIASPPKSKPHAAMPLADIPALMGRLVADGSPAARALAFLILTAARRAEARDARWEEIKGNVFTIPGPRMKELVEHSVPLCPAALALLGKPLGTGPIFAGLAQRSLDGKLKASGGGAATVHGFRSAFTGWAVKAGYPKSLWDRALAHATGNANDQAYDRERLIEERREMMLAYSNFCAGA
jgi:integrase